MDATESVIVNGHPAAEAKKEEEIIDRTSPPGGVVYEAVYREGEHELNRPTSALALSGLAAGLSMGFSLVSEGLLHFYLPKTPWSPLITKLGYSVGFLIVILGRQQLFTKNTLTVILPLLKQKQLALFINVARLWAIVLLANLVGAFVFAFFVARTNIFDPGVHASFAEISGHTMQPDFLTILLRAVLAGWLIALMIWLLPYAEAARVSVIVFLAYLIGLANLPHIIAGNVETFYLVSRGALRSPLASRTTWFRR